MLFLAILFQVQFLNHSLQFVLALAHCSQTRLLFACQTYSSSLSLSHNSRIFPHKLIYFHSHIIHIPIPDYNFTISHSYARIHFLMHRSYTISLNCTLTSINKFKHHKHKQGLVIRQSLPWLLSFSENSLTISLAQSVSRETRLLFLQFAQKLSKKCLASPSSAALLRRRGEDSFCNRLLGPPMAVSL
jgi:hypothetical protein